ncbi:MAG: 50S ribosomal protein L17 [Armatimonadetes bacterium]|nr:50S ribosomal protein L17 [Armatimonadota bacterium]
MRHKNDHRKLGLPSDQRRALLTNLARQMIRTGYVHTTLGRSKELQRVVEKLITLGKANTVPARREARKVLVGHSKSSPRPERALAGKSDIQKLEILRQRSLINGEDLVAHLFDHVAPRFKDRQGGYTRLTKTGQRRGDAAVTAVLEFVD